jgi:hypothetical protein
MRPRLRAAPSAASGARFRRTRNSAFRADSTIVACGRNRKVVVNANLKPLAATGHNRSRNLGVDLKPDGFASVGVASMS